MVVIMSTKNPGASFCFGRQIEGCVFYRITVLENPFLPNHVSDSNIRPRARCIKLLLGAMMVMTPAACHPVSSSANVSSASTRAPSLYALPQIAWVGRDISTTACKSATAASAAPISTQLHPLRRHHQTGTPMITTVYKNTIIVYVDLFFLSFSCALSLVNEEVAIPTAR